MFIILLNFSDNKSQASQFMEGHNEWIKRGFDEGVFLLAGGLQPNILWPGNSTNLNFCIGICVGS